MTRFPDSLIDATAVSVVDILPIDMFVNAVLGVGN